MKLSPETLAVLRNFSMVENSIYIDEPSVLKIINSTGSIIAIADIEEVFPEVGIYNFSAFVQSLSMFKDIDLDFTEDAIIIAQGDKKIKYKASSADVIQNKCKESVKYKEHKEKVASLTLTSETIMDTLKMAKVLSSDLIQITMKDGVGELTTTSTKIENSSNNYTDTISGEGDCKVRILTDNLNLIQGDYDIEVTERHIRFTNKSFPVFYIISLYTGK